MALLCAGCTTPEGARDRTESARQTPPAPTIERRPPSLLSTVAFSTREPVRLIVRNATQADLQQDLYQSEQKQAAGGALLGTGSIGLGYAAGPMFGGALVLGGALIGVAAGAYMATESSRQHEIELSLKQTDFSAMLEHSLGQALAQTARDDPATSLEILPLRYGVMEIARHGELCVVAEISATLCSSGRELYRDRILIMPYLRSTDAPVPLCLPRKSLSENDAKAVRAALAEYAVTLPAILKQRLPGLPWKP